MWGAGVCAPCAVANDISGACLSRAQFRFKLLPWAPLAQFSGVSMYTLDEQARRPYTPPLV